MEIKRSRSAWFFSKRTRWTPDSVPGGMVRMSRMSRQPPKPAKRLRIRHDGRAFEGGGQTALGGWAPWCVD
eukprot:2550212-Heterocapsa_arctica.AAC.1